MGASYWNLKIRLYTGVAEKEVSTYFRGLICQGEDPIVLDKKTFDITIRDGAVAVTPSEAL